MSDDIIQTIDHHNTADHQHGTADHHDQGDSGRSESLRASLERSWEEQTGKPPEGARARERELTEESRTAEPRNRPAREAEHAAQADTTIKQTDTAAPGEGAQPAPLGQRDAAPSAWSKEAKAVWAHLPPAAKAAIEKRERDVERGVSELKARYADLDKVLEPHMPTIRSFGHSASDAVRQLFAWHMHLAKDPVQGLKDLGRSYGVDVTKLGGDHIAEMRSQTQRQPDLTSYINQTISQNLAPIYENMANQQQAQINEILAKWSAEKPYYERVRSTMSRLIGTGVVPLKDGAVDLDGAYAVACRMDETINKEMYEAERAAERKAQTDVAQRARRAAASLSPTSPGSTAGSAAKPKTRGKSVRESLQDALAEAREARF